MTKKKFNHIFDVLFYCVVTLLPLIAYLLHLHHFNDMTLIDVFNSLGVNNTNIIFTSLVDIFGESGYLPIISDNSPIFYFFTYMVLVNLIHLMVDFILFIPNIAHKYLNYFYQKD